MRTLSLATPLLVGVLVLGAGCGDSGGRESTGQTGVTSQGTLTSLSGSESGAPTASSGDSDSPTGATDDPSAGTATDADGTTAVDPSAGPKFDLPPTPDAGMPMPETGCQKVDLLFVIDSSGSMADEQQNLIASFPDFVSEMQTKLADTDSYHVGITTSDAYAYNTPGCNQAGALVTKTGGTNSSNQTCGPYASGKNWMSETDDLGQKFACAGQVGTQGDGNEAPMYTLGQALSPGLNAAGACNDGFLREDALLVIVVITDEEDDHEIAGCMVAAPGSPGEPTDWFNTVVAAKGGIETNIVTLALVGPIQPPCPMLDKCQGGIQGAEVANRIVQFTQMFTYGSIGPICAPSYKDFFGQAISVISTACENFMPPG
jgi:hypothetical protein